MYLPRRESEKPFSVLLDKHSWAVLIDIARGFLGQTLRSGRLGAKQASPEQTPWAAGSCSHRLVLLLGLYLAQGKSLTSKFRTEFGDRREILLSYM